MENLTNQELKNNLAQFHGTEQWYRIPLSDIIYTDGVKYLVDTAECWWLVTNIASQQHRQELKDTPFQVWKLKKDGNSAMLICEDGNDNIVFKTFIMYTDFPLDTIKLFLTDNVLMLPSEY